MVLGLLTRAVQILSCSGKRGLLAPSPLMRNADHHSNNTPQQQRMQQYTTSRPDIETITQFGQVWEKDDYRNARFMNAKRYLVEKEYWPMTLKMKLPVIETTKRIISCDGGGVFGHPRVYYNMDDPNYYHVCFYCGQRFTNPNWQKKY